MGDLVHAGFELLQLLRLEARPKEVTNRAPRCFAIKAPNHVERRERREICVALSQLKELGEQAIVAVAASLVDGGAVLKAQLIASRFYEALRHELEESSLDDAKRAALTAASDRCERIAADAL